MSTAKAGKTAAKFTFDQLETLGSQLKPQVQPFIDEARDEIMGFFKSPRIGGKPKELGHEDLARAREHKKIEEVKHEDDAHSEERAREILAMYRESAHEAIRENNELKAEHEELKEEVVKLAKASGVETNIHLQNSPKVGKIDISFLTFIIRTLRVKAEQSKSASDLVVERTQIKATGMNAWVSGKQMKIHEQGTMQLQG